MPGGLLPGLLLVLFVVVFVGTALDAYSVAGVPLPWLAQGIAISAALLLLVSKPRRRPPGFSWFLVFLLWTLATTAGAAALGSYADLMPSHATTPYPLFLALRVVVLVSFAAFLLLVWRLLELGRERDLLRWTSLAGAALALFAIYIYLAHVNGWPEPPRTRLGTAGGSQNVRFTYEFHRALGTFREPSQLAIWLTIPLFASLAWTRRALNAAAIVMSTAILLTGSTTGLLGIVGGTFAGILLGRPFQRDSRRALLALAITFACGAAGFRALVVPYDDTVSGTLADASPASVLHSSSAPQTVPPSVPSVPPSLPPFSAVPEAPAVSAPVPRTPPAVAAGPSPAAPAVDPRASATATPQAPVPLAAPATRPVLAMEDLPAPVPAAAGKDAVLLWGDVLQRHARNLASRGLVAGTNREYVLRFMVEDPPGWLGVGLGNANLLLTRFLQSQLVVSYLSLYFNVAYAAGLVGLALLLTFLAHPLVATLRRVRMPAGDTSLPRIGAYVAALVAFAGVLEELALPFALAYALLAGRKPEPVEREPGAPLLEPINPARNGEAREARSPATAPGAR
jgi:hypothetical protein